MTTQEQLREQFKSSTVWSAILANGDMVVDPNELYTFMERFISQATKEAVEVKMSELYKEIKKRRESRLDDPWAFGFNVDMTAGSSEDLMWVLSLLSPHSIPPNAGRTGDRGLIK